ncbi:MAG: hypothetical protein FWH41_04015 [Treponema sp.]|nr:hypothetical protein [Treponema sp.]
MKNKLFLTALCAIGLSLILACSMDGDATTAPAARELDAGISEPQDTGIDESDDFSEQFYLNQDRSFSLLDEAMSPFRTEFDETRSEENQLFCESFAGVWIDGNGNLNIGIVQGEISREAEISMNRFREQVTYRYDEFSYNFLASMQEAVSEVMEGFEIHGIGVCWLSLASIAPSICTAV